MGVGGEPGTEELAGVLRPHANPPSLSADTWPMSARRRRSVDATLTEEARRGRRLRAASPGRRALVLHVEQLRPLGSTSADNTFNWSANVSFPPPPFALP